VIEDSPIERTPDLVGKVRALREQATRQMDRFTNPADYDVRRVVGRAAKPAVQAVPVPAEKKKRVRTTEQVALDFAFAEHKNGGTE